MRIAIPTTGKRKLSNRVADTFSRAPTFTFVTLENLEIKGIEVIENHASGIEQGAGPIAVRIIKDHGIDLLISGEIGPGARTILEAFDIKIHEASVGKKVSEVVEEWKKLEL
jgi:predicted Fe-Mo cluster-binding NifX family protein